MSLKMSNRIPDIVIGRLPLYLRALNRLQNEGRDVTSSHELGRRLGISSAQIRKDLSHFGGFGKQGTGYQIEFLIDKLEEVLQVNLEWSVAVIGAGDLGSAISHYGGFMERGFRISWLFDADDSKVGQDVGQQVAKRFGKSILELLTNQTEVVNIALDYRLKNSMSSAGIYNDGDIDIDVENTVVMISVSDKLLFKSGSYKVNSEAFPLLQKLTDVINSEPSMDVMIEGHTDSRTINNAVVKDNWDLSVKRATSIVRLLEKKYFIKPNRLIASGRGSSVPLVENNTKENRARNRSDESRR